MTGKIKQIVACGVFLLCAACTPRLDLATNFDRYNSATSCCADLAQMPFEPIGGRSEIVFAVGPDSPAFDFPAGGLSYFRAFELPARDRDYAIVLRSYIFSNADSSRTAALFYPRLTILDAQKRQIVTTDERQWQWIRSSMSDEPNSSHRASRSRSPSSRAIEPATSSFTVSPS